MVKMSNTEILNNLKELKYHSRALNLQLEDSGLSPVDSAAGKEKNTLFDSNVIDIANAIEGLLRGEAAERHILRLENAIPEAKKNIRHIAETPAGKSNIEGLRKLKDLINYFESNFRQI